MDTNEEIELLQQKLADSKREGALGGLGLVWGAIGFGWIAQWYFTSRHIPITAVMLPLIGLGCAMFGSLLAGLFVLGFRTRGFGKLRRSETDRFEQKMFGK